MLKTASVSARSSLRCCRPRLDSIKACKLTGLHSQHNYSRLWVEGHRRRLFTSVASHEQEPSAVVETGRSFDDVSPLPRLESEARERAKKLPISCPGCGAPSQTIDPAAAGFYGSRRASKATQTNAQKQEEDEIFQNALQSGDLPSELPTSKPSIARATQSPNVPICDRCHYLRYQSRGNSIIHPSMQSIQQIIEESPHKQNHIYHTLDAADFPMSLIPNLVSALHLPRLRTQNRRSKSVHYIRGRVAEVSFIITRSDLLAPKKEQVDSLVPYLRDVLRDALGRSGKNIRLGNVRCVSAKRGWWTRTVKEDIYNRGGAGWMVGKVNVGKSALYEVVFPKGRNNEEVDVEKMRRREEQKTWECGLARWEGHDAENHAPSGQMSKEQEIAFADSPGELSETRQSQGSRLYDPSSFQESELEIGSQHNEEEQEDLFFDESEDSSLLPPARAEIAYPDMPLVSALPGTTASPIRIPFGNGKGELIDLPGIQRSSLDTFVKPEHRKELVMTNRVVPEQHTIKAGQALLLGGLIRITAKTDDLIFLAYPFTTLAAHVTSNDKAIAIQTGSHPDGEPYTGTVDTISTNAAKQSIESAGTFKLHWDVTKTRSGPLTDRAAGKQKTANLPFIVYSADILIEGVGWVELTCQVRNRRRSFITDAFGERSFEREEVPEVEVWSPEGKFVGVRRPMNAWVLGGPKRVPVYKRKARPKMSLSFQRRKAGGARVGQGKLLMAMIKGARVTW